MKKCTNILIPVWVMYLCSWQLFLQQYKQNDITQEWRKIEPLFLGHTLAQVRHWNFPWHMAFNGICWPRMSLNSDSSAIATWLYFVLYIPCRVVSAKFCPMWFSVCEWGASWALYGQTLWENPINPSGTPNSLILI